MPSVNLSSLCSPGLSCASLPGALVEVLFFDQVHWVSTRRHWPAKLRLLVGFRGQVRCAYDPGRLTVLCRNVSHFLATTWCLPGRCLASTWYLGDVLPVVCFRVRFARWSSGVRFVFCEVRFWTGLDASPEGQM